MNDKMIDDKPLIVLKDGKWVDADSEGDPPPHPRGALFAPGPYDITTDKDGVDDEFVVWYAPRYPIRMTFWNCSVESTSRAFAQARLFAASPDMVEMLYALVEGTDAIPLSHTPPKLFEAREKAKSLLAKLVSTPTYEESMRCEK